MKLFIIKLLLKAKVKGIIIEKILNNPIKNFFKKSYYKKRILKYSPLLDYEFAFEIIQEDGIPYVSRETIEKITDLSLQLNEILKNELFLNKQDTNSMMKSQFISEYMSFKIYEAIKYTQQ